MAKGPETARTKGGPARDFTNVGQIAEPPFVRLPDPGTLFAARSKRLAALAEGHPLSPYLRFLSRLVDVQDRAQRSLLPPRMDQATLEPLLAGGIPPLSRAAAFPGAPVGQTLDWFVAHAALAEAPDEAEAARLRLAAMPAHERGALVETILSGAYPASMLGESLYAAAALQVALSRMAEQLEAGRFRPGEDNICPACGGAPVASLIVGWAGADRARYCACALCQTMWNYTRIKCTSCGSTAGVSYLQIEGQSPNVAVETCETCRTYIKHLRGDKAPALDPVADDIASFGLDLLVQEREFRRATTNPLMVKTA